MTSYHIEYDGYYTMRRHDDEPNVLLRWFDNYKIERYASFATEYEWLVVKEVSCDSKTRKTRLVCEIGDDGRGTKREVIMDHSTPPAPVLTFAAKRRWEPPPPKTAQQLKQEAEWEMMHRRGYEPIRRARYRPMTLSAIDWASGPDMTATVEMEYDIEWVPRRRMFEMPSMPMLRSTPQPPKQHRRNV